MSEISLDIVEEEIGSAHDVLSRRSGLEEMRLVFIQMILASDSSGDFGASECFECRRSLRSLLIGARLYFGGFREIHLEQL